MTISEKVAYMKGVADALELNAGDKKDRLIQSMLDAMEEMALALTDLETGLDALGEQVDEIDEDLGAVEETVYEFDADECDCDCDGDCVEAVCPQCGASIPVDLEQWEEDEPVICPECGAKLEFELVEDDDDQPED